MQGLLEYVVMLLLRNADAIVFDGEKPLIPFPLSGYMDLKGFHITGFDGIANEPEFLNFYIL